MTPIYPTLCILSLLLALASSALAGPVRCTTYEEKSLGRLQTVCDDGTRACTRQMNPRTRQVEVRCR
jgi:hypothetical protein